jgi:hypothetical protein
MAGGFVDIPQTKIVSVAPVKPAQATQPAVQHVQTIKPIPQSIPQRPQTIPLPVVQPAQVANPPPVENASDYLEDLLAKGFSL